VRATAVKHGRTNGNLGRMGTTLCAHRHGSVSVLSRDVMFSTSEQRRLGAIRTGTRAIAFMQGAVGRAQHVRLSSLVPSSRPPSAPRRRRAVYVVDAHAKKESRTPAARPSASGPATPVQH